MPVIPTNKPLKPRRPHDFYPTPYSLARAFAATIFPVEYADTPRVLDVGADSGVWGIALGDEYWTRGRLMPELVGVEIRDVEGGRSSRYKEWVTGDFFSPSLPLSARSFDYVIGNPPYSVAQKAVERGMEFLKPGGWLYYLLRLEFLASQKRADDFFHTNRPSGVWVCSARPSFTGDGRTDAVEYAIMGWQKDAPPDYPSSLYFWNWKRYMRENYPQHLEKRPQRKKGSKSATDYVDDARPAT